MIVVIVDGDYFGFDGIEQPFLYLIKTLRNDGGSVLTSTYSRGATAVPPKGQYQFAST